MNPKNLTIVFVTVSVATFVARKIIRRAKIGAVAKGSVRREDQLSTVEMLPEELLCSISDNLPLADCMSLSRVCKGLRSATFSRLEMANFSRDRPWLLFYGLEDDDDTGYLYSDSHSKCCPLKLPGLRGATCVDSRFGWVLARRGRRFFFYNPFSMEKIDVPAKYPHSDAAEQVYAFEGFPTSLYCTVTVVIRREGSTTLEISSCRVGDMEWGTHKIEDHVGGLLVGTLGYAKTRYADKGHLYIYTQPKTSVLRYNITNKKWAQWNIELNETEGTEEDTGSSMFNGTRDVHHNDWVSKFGKRGSSSISVSICALHSRITPTNSNSMASLLTSSTRVVVAQNGRIQEGAVVGLKNVKAVWIEPPWKYKRRDYGFLGWSRIPVWTLVGITLWTVCTGCFEIRFFLVAHKRSFYIPLPLLWLLDSYYNVNWRLD